MQKPTLIILTLFTLAIATGLGVVLGTAQPTHDTGDSLPPPMTGAKIGGEINLKTHTGALFQRANYTDQHFLIFFGFANCPGICPVELDKMTEALNALPDEVESQIQPIFITLDPERDTNEMLDAFLEPFHPDLLALTGTQEEVNAVSDQWRVFADFLEPQEDGMYMINHSTYTYLMTPDMKPLDIFKMEDTAETMTKRLEGRLRG